METQTVTPDASGNYSVLLGSTTATGLPADLFSQEEQRWLGVQVEGQAEQPRVLLVSVPYAFKAHEAETLGGKSVSDFVLANGGNFLSEWQQRQPGVVIHLRIISQHNTPGINERRSQCRADELQRLDYRPDCRRYAKWYRSGSKCLCADKG